MRLRNAARAVLVILLARLNLPAARPWTVAHATGPAIPAHVMVQTVYRKFHSGGAILLRDGDGDGGGDRAGTVAIPRVLERQLPRMRDRFVPRTSAGSPYAAPAAVEIRGAFEGVTTSTGQDACAAQ